MKRISHRSHAEPGQVAQIRYVEKQVAVPIEKVVESSVDLNAVHQKHVDLELKAQAMELNISHNFHDIAVELEMQRRALIGLKQQRDIDRKRRLQFIIRIKKERDAQKKLSQRYKLAVGACLLLSILSLIIK